MILMPDPTAAADTEKGRRVFMPAVLDDAGLSCHQFRVFAHLARHRADYSPRVEQMARTCCMKPDAVRAAIQALEARRMIRIIAPPGRARQYVLTPASEWITEGETPANIVPLPQNGTPPPKQEGSFGGPLPQKGRGEVGDPSPKSGVHPSPKTGGDPSPKTAPHEETQEESQQDDKDSILILSSTIAADAAEVGEEGRKAEVREEKKAAALAAAVAIGAIMHRKKLPGEWSEDEKKAFGKLCKAAVPTAEEIAAVRARYDAEWPPREGNYLRRDLLTLIRHWSVEVDRANHHAEAQRAPEVAPRPAPQQSPKPPRKAYVIPGYTPAVAPVA